MILFPHAKINLGLNVTERRQDGFHNIETVFYPVGLSDILEFIISPDGKMKFENTGIKIGNDDDNLCIRAYFLLKRKFDLPPLHIHLHKIIPIGAGLGGGSSNVTFFIRGLNDFLKLGISDQEMENILAALGSDCSFFMYNQPLLAKEKGDKFSSIDLSLRGMHLVIIYPNIVVSTADAYSGIVPKKPNFSIKNIIKKPIYQWKGQLKNDFEDVIFRKHQEIKMIKEKLYQNGAVYAAMSGSGSAVFGIFNRKPNLQNFDQMHFIWDGVL